MGQDRQDSHKQKKKTHRSVIEHLKEPFLEQYRKFKFIGQAARAVGIHPDTVLSWKRLDPAFAAKFTQIDLDVASQLNTELEQSAIQRGIYGAPVYATKDGQNILQKDPATGEVLKDANGNPVPVILKRDFETGLTIFLLKTRMADKYTEVIKQEIDIKIIQSLSSEFLSLIRKHVPDFCPHCKNSLAITPKIAKELETLSAKLSRS